VLWAKITETNNLPSIKLLGSGDIEYCELEDGTLDCGVVLGSNPLKVRVTPGNQELMETILGAQYIPTRGYILSLTKATFQPICKVTVIFLTTRIGVP